MSSTSVRIDSKKVTIILLCLSAFAYFLPFLINHPYITATAAGDDNLYAYRAILDHPERFENDVLQFVSKGHIQGTLMNYGGLWLIRSVGIPIYAVHNFFLFLQLFGLPTIFVILLWKRLNVLERLTTFLLSASVGFVYWNFANFGEIPVPYAANLALPFLWLGIWGVAHNDVKGFLLLTLGCLLHPSFGLQCIFVLFVYCLLTRQTVLNRNLWLLAVPALCAIGQALYAVGGDYPRVTDQELWRVLELNMHTTPWEATFRWQSVFPGMVAIGFLAWSSQHLWGELGPVYKRILISACVASAFLCASQIVGHIFKLPQVVLLVGLRSPTLVIMFLFPIFILYFKHRLSSSVPLEHFLVTFILILLIIGRPYGLDKSPIILLGLTTWVSGRDRIGPLSRQRAIQALVILTAIWVAAFFFYTPEKPNIFSTTRVDKPWTLFDYWRVNAVLDFGPLLDLTKKLLCVVPALIVACWPTLNTTLGRFNLKRLGQFSPAVIAGCFIFLISGKLILDNHLAFGKEYNRDLYEAQVWAKNNTSPDVTFMALIGTWRSFSERALFPLLPQRYYYYSQDRRAKDFDDLLLGVYDLEKAFETVNQRRWYMGSRAAYTAVFKNPLDFGRMSLYTRARYLIETRTTDKLPLAFENATFKIYDLFPVGKLIYESRQQSLNKESAAT